jgi:hypothetical protein
MESDFTINYRGWDRWVTVFDLVSDGGNDRHITHSKLLLELLLKLVWCRHKEKVVLHSQSPSAGSIVHVEGVWEAMISSEPKVYEFRRHPSAVIVSTKLPSVQNT